MACYPTNGLEAASSNGNRRTIRWACRNMLDGQRLIRQRGCSGVPAPRPPGSRQSQGYIEELVGNKILYSILILTLPLGKFVQNLAPQLGGSSTSVSLECAGVARSVLRCSAWLLHILRVSHGPNCRVCSELQ